MCECDINKQKLDKGHINKRLNLLLQYFCIKAQDKRKKNRYKDSHGSSRFSEKVQYKAAVYHRLTPSEINASKVKLYKFQNRRHVKFSPPVDMTRIVAKKIELHFTAKKLKTHSFYSHYRQS